MTERIFLQESQQMAERQKALMVLGEIPQGTLSDEDFERLVVGTARLLAPRVGTEYLCRLFQRTSDGQIKDCICRELFWRLRPADGVSIERAIRCYLSLNCLTNKGGKNE